MEEREQRECFTRDWCGRLVIVGETGKKINVERQLGANELEKARERERDKNKILTRVGGEDYADKEK